MATTAADAARRPVRTTPMAERFASATAMPNPLKKLSRQVNEPMGTNLKAQPARM